MKSSWNPTASPLVTIDDIVADNRLVLKKPTARGRALAEMKSTLMNLV
jgi:hypothetical protein